MANIGLCFVSAAAEVSSNFVLQMARRTEEIGLHSFWVNDRITYDNLDPLTVVTAAAAVTQRIKLGTSILLAPLWPPVLLAKSLASIDFLSQGRLIIGIGIGGAKGEFDAVEVPFAARGTRASEQIRLMKRLWREERVSHQGKFFHVEDLTVGPRPTQSPHPPIWLGGAAESALRRVGRLADGYICGTLSLMSFPSVWQKISTYAVEAGRDPAKIEKAGITYIAINEDKRTAVEAGEAYLKRNYGKVTLDVEAHMVIGPPGACADRLAAIFERGFDTLILRLIVPELSQIDLIGEKVLPRL